MANEHKRQVNDQDQEDPGNGNSPDTHIFGEIQGNLGNFVEEKVRGIGKFGEVRGNWGKF